MSTEIFYRFTFDSAHWLPRVPESHKCSRLHGHTYNVELTLAGEPGLVSGWIVDYAVVKEALRPVLHAVDHRELNQVPGLGNPTSENLARWLFESLVDDLPQLSVVSVGETANAGARYRRS